ncbi:UDP-glucose 4-epimerase GalE [Providencia huaxiensis]|uniref:UDP-glucose 4-epimerase n=1 Tax=Providencia huaxiensis TaxID=2027290 RepID=A0ABU2J3V4_9GAMM|nr:MULTISPECIES: UDP-glucose 4-epimerase GalE [Providencia]MBZ3681770.1 UDP-glucose 4-epimerase GalE [Providencia rettgeri]AXH63822.1 UDP-glucose 4-epimerase GalE [Providencia huaxiensis]MBN6360292.1 UDP-glucose 4-epimerase GalE [Providencia huaxiensis]MBQ0532849.1 UDP-glucose 4-epimerase GalE [Providencia huaxiensis]MBQ0587315.1 UDP-glucose 4-epimerase GalE [Providencia huaxiensis]
MEKVEILVSGGMGYIGSHTCVELIKAGYIPVILDNLINSNIEVLNRIEKLTGVRPVFFEGDIREASMLRCIFKAHNIQSVIHFAGLKAVGESVEKPLSYYDVNVNGTLVLLKVMQEHGIHSIIFSSSATVYGEPDTVPIDETFSTGATTSPYGTSKHMVERILTDLQSSAPEWSITLLRYFNPVGAHSSGEMGEDPSGIPNNLTPYITQVAVGKRPILSIFGDDYPTIDGTGVRDYIHVMDLADGHVAALDVVSKQPGLHVYNLGTGKGTSVLEMLHAFEVACGKPIAHEFKARRQGDIAEYWSTPEKAQRELHWKATRNIQDMADDAWRWQSNNPEGYNDSNINK